MDILILIDKLDDVLYNARPIPLTEQVRVDRKQVFDILDEMRATLPEEIKQARWIVKERGDEGPDEPEGNHRLGEIAASLEELKRSQRPTPPPLTAAAAEQVRAIVEAAETSATSVQQQAEKDAKEVVEGASKRDVEMRRKTAAESAARLGRAEKATDAMIADARKTSVQIRQLVDSLRGPASALDEILASGASSLRTDLAGLKGRLAEFEGRDADQPERPEQPERPKRPSVADAATTTMKAEPPDGGYVSAERLTGPPALNRVTHRHLPEDQG